MRQKKTHEMSLYWIVFHSSICTGSPQKNTSIPSPLSALSS